MVVRVFTFYRRRDHIPKLHTLAFLRNWRKRKLKVIGLWKRCGGCQEVAPSITPLRETSRGEEFRGREQGASIKNHMCLSGAWHVTASFALAFRSSPP